jgi:hypothetical protein
MKNFLAAFLLCLGISFTAEAQQVPHPVGGPAASVVAALPCWGSVYGDALKRCDVQGSPMVTSTALTGLISTTPGGPGIGLFGGYAQNLFQISGSGYTAGGSPYNPPLAAVEGDATVTCTLGVPCTTSGTTHVGGIFYSSMNANPQPFTYTAGKLEYFMGAYIIGGQTTTCGGSLPANPCSMIWGATIHATLYAPAAAVLYTTGLELDMDNMASTETASRIALHIGDIGAKQANAGGYDAGITISKSSTAIGFRTGIDFTNVAASGVGNGFGVAPGGTLIGATASGTVGTLIDLYNVTCTSSWAILLKSGWGVDCNGATIMPTSIKNTTPAGYAFNFFNNLDQDNSFNIDSGLTTSKIAGIGLSDRGSIKYALYKDIDNSLSLVAGGVTPAIFKYTGDIGVNRIFFGVPVGIVATTVSGLPGCNVNLNGFAYWVTDAAASPVYLATVTAGGTAKVLAICNGTTTTWQNH